MLRERPTDSCNCCTEAAETNCTAGRNARQILEATGGRGREQLERWDEGEALTFALCFRYTDLLF